MQVQCWGDVEVVNFTFIFTSAVHVALEQIFPARLPCLHSLDLSAAQQQHPVTFVRLADFDAEPPDGLPSPPPPALLSELPHGQPTDFIGRTLADDILGSASTEGETTAEREEELRGQLDREDEDRHSRSNVEVVLQKQPYEEEDEDLARVIVQLRAALAVKDLEIAREGNY